MILLLHSPLFLLRQYTMFRTKFNIRHFRHLRNRMTDTCSIHVATTDRLYKAWMSTGLAPTLDSSTLLCLERLHSLEPVPTLCQVVMKVGEFSFTQSTKSCPMRIYLDLSCTLQAFLLPARICSPDSAIEFELLWRKRVEGRRVYFLKYSTATY